MAIQELSPGEIDMNALHLAERLINIEKRRAGVLILPKLMFPHKFAYRDTLNRALEDTGTRPLSVRQITFEAVQGIYLSPSERAVNMVAENLYGICLPERRFGLCHPDTRLAQEQVVYESYIETAFWRLFRGIPNVLSFDELVEWGRQLKIKDPYLPPDADQKLPRHRLVLVRPKAWRQEES